MSMKLGFQIPIVSGFQIPWAVFQIPKPSILDSTSKNFADTGLRKQKVLDYAIRIPLLGSNKLLFLKCSWEYAFRLPRAFENKVLCNFSLFGVNCGGFELNKEWKWILRSQTRVKDHLCTPSDTRQIPTFHDVFRDLMPLPLTFNVRQRYFLISICTPIKGVIKYVWDSSQRFWQRCGKMMSEIQVKGSLEVSLNVSEAQIKDGAKEPSNMSEIQVKSLTKV